RRDQRDPGQIGFTEKVCNEPAASGKQHGEHASDRDIEPKQGTGLSVGDTRLLSQRIGSAQIDNERGKSHQSQDHGDKTEVMRAQQPSQQDRRCDLRKYVYTARSDKRQSSVQGCTAKAGKRLILLEILVELAVQMQTLVPCRLRGQSLLTGHCEVRSSQI